MEGSGVLGMSLFKMESDDDAGVGAVFSQGKNGMGTGRMGEELTHGKAKLSRNIKMRN